MLSSVSNGVASMPSASNTSHSCTALQERQQLRRRTFSQPGAKAGCTRLNQQKVLKDLVKPPADVPAPEASGEPTLSSGSSQDETPRISAAPITPVTPVTAEAFLTLHDFILESDAHALEETGKQSIQRHLQKLTKGASP